jgi:hypothetical protein
MNKHTRVLNGSHKDGIIIFTKNMLRYKSVIANQSVIEIHFSQYGKLDPYDFCFR